MYADDRRPRVPPGLAHVVQDGRHLLVHPIRPLWLAVNDLGSAVACLCDGQHTVAEIAGQLARRFRVEPARAYQDVLAYLADLDRAGFLEDAPDAPDGPAPAFTPTLRGLRLHLNITARCNLHCRHCGVLADGHAVDRLSPARLLALVDELAAGGGEAVALSGGEPLLRDDWRGLVRQAAARLKTLVSTNATLIDDAAAAELVESGAVVQVSLDGATPATHDAVRGAGAFHAAWRGIEHLQRRGIGERLALAVTVLGTNWREIPAIVDLAEAQGIAGVRFFPVQRLGRAIAHWPDLAVTPAQYAQVYDYLYRQLPARRLRVRVDGGCPGLVLSLADGEWWCRLGRTLTVEADGRIAACSLLTDDAFGLGDARRDSLAAALASPVLRDLIATAAGRMDAIPACRVCAWRAFCQGGCPGSVWLAAGTWYATDGLCEVRQRLYPDVIFDRT